MDKKKETTTTPIPRVDDSSPLTAHVSGDTQSPIKRQDGSEIKWFTTDTMVTEYGPELMVAKYDRTVPIYTSINKKKRYYDKKKKKTEKNLRRASTQVRRLAMANFPIRPKKYLAPCFLTLTYKCPERAHPKNRYKHLADVQDFFRKLRMQYGNNIKYIQVFEIQPKRLSRTGKPCVHVHALIFNLPYNDYDTVFSFWPHGTKNNQELDRLKYGRKNCVLQSKKLSNYITKMTNYMTKAEQDELVSYYEKTYLPSKGLNKPKKYTRAIDAQMRLLIAKDDGYEITHTSPKFYIPYYNAWVFYEVWVPT